MEKQIKDSRAYLENFASEAITGAYRTYSDEGAAFKLGQKIFNLYQGSGAAADAGKEAELVEKVAFYRRLHGKRINLRDERGRW